MQQFSHFPLHLWTEIEWTWQPIQGCLSRAVSTSRLIFNKWEKKIRGHWPIILISESGQLEMSSTEPIIEHGLVNTQSQWPTRALHEQGHGIESLNSTERLLRSICCQIYFALFFILLKVEVQQKEQNKFTINWT